MVPWVLNMSQSQTSPDTQIDLRPYHPLGRLRWFIRGYVFCEGLLMALICVCLWFWFTFTLDFSLQYFFGVDLLDSARIVRWMLAFGFGALLVFFLGWYIFRRIFREFQSRSLALVLEKRFPELLGDRLITAIELANLKNAAKLGYSVDMIRKTMMDARERVDRVPISHVFSWRRLALTAWTLVGVSAMALLLAFPIAVLFSLFDVKRGPDLWRMLVVNLLIVIGLVLVYFSPFLISHCWRSSSKLRGFTVGLGIVALIGTTVGYLYAMDSTKHLSQNEYWWRLYHGTSITMSRDLAFSETRWPRDEYFVEWLDFPVDEKRIQQNKQIMARAYFCRFIVSDGTVEKRWRPLEWRDLSKKELAIAKIPELPLDRINAYLYRLTEGDPESPVGFDAAAMEYPTAANIKVDLVIAAVLDEETGFFNDDERAMFKQLESTLEQRAADLKLGGRVIRQIAAPEELKLAYRELKSKNDSGDTATVIRQTLKVLDGRKNVYSLEQKLPLSKLVRLNVEGTVNKKAVRSKDRLVDMIQPPVLDMLEYQEFRPAYYYYLPPTGPRADTIDERRNLFKNLLQPMPVFRQSQPPESVAVTINSGSALRVQAIADKPLKEVQAYYREFTPEGGAKPNESRIPLQISKDKLSFDLLFTAKGKPIEDLSAQWWMWDLPVQPSWAVRPGSKDYQPALAIVGKPMTFDLVMTDTDNMTATRSVTVTPSADGLPNVTLFVSTIRKVEEQGSRRSYYMCTAKAEIPFAKESYVVDDHGIHKVEFAYEYLPLSNTTDAIFRAGLASWLWASTPIQPSIGDFLFRREVLLRTVGTTKRPDPIQGVAPIDNFALEQRKANQDRPPLSIAELEKLLQAPLADQVASPILKRFDFWNKDEDRPVTFDINRRLPDLQRKHPITGEQTSYEMTLDVRATDSNVQSTEARFGTFKDGALTFRVVPEEVLIRHIAREEHEQADKLDEIIKKLDAQYKILQIMGNRIPMSLTAETAVSEQTRIENVLDTITKQREGVTGITDTYARLIEEYRTNRYDRKLWSGLDEKVRDPLAKTQVNEFPVAEVAITTFKDSLKDGLPGVAIPAIGPAILKLSALIEKLRAIRATMGETYDLKRIILEIDRIRQEQIASENALKNIEKDYFEGLLYIRLFNPPIVVDVPVGGKTNVKINIQMAGSINITPPHVTLSVVEKDSGIKVPEKVILTGLKEGERSILDFDITAGMKPGTYELIVKTSQSLKETSIKVVVK